MKRQRLQTLREETDWLCSAVDAFQRVLFCGFRRPIDLQRLRRELGRIPIPATPFERFVSRYLIVDCIIALLSCEVGDRRAAREYVAFLGTLHSGSDLMAGFSKLVTRLCRPQNNSDASLADEIHSRIEKEYASRMTAERIAEECNLTHAQLDRIFIQRFGLRFHEHLTTVRVRHGVDLVSGGMKVEAAAPAVGYKSKKDFYRAVKNHTGLTPGQLRRQRNLAAAEYATGAEAVTDERAT